MEPTYSHTQQPPQPAPILETRMFWDGARHGNLILPRCGKCGRITAPLSPRCPDCLSAALEPMECSGRATLKGRTVLHVAAFNGQSLPAVLVECAIEEEPRVVLVANDPDDSTLGLPPGASVRIGFSVTGDDMTPLARVLPGDVT